MGIKEDSKKVVAGAGLVIAVASVIGCDEDGQISSDPAPPPLGCTDVDQGQTLAKTATLNSKTLTISLEQNAYTVFAWKDASATNVQNATVTEVRLPQDKYDPLIVILELDSSSTTTGSFTLQGTFLDSNAADCAVQRTFTFNITSPTQIEVAWVGRDKLPLSARDQAKITMIQRKDQEVELEVTTSFASPKKVAWGVTDGEIVSIQSRKMKWKLPTKAGFYQAEVYIDYGESGFGYDTMMIEAV